MQVTFFNNNLRTGSGVFTSHLLSLMHMVDGKKHIINFITIRREQLNSRIRDVVNGAIHHLDLLTFFRVLYTLKKSDLVICRNYLPAFFALLVKFIFRGNYRVHADLRGIVPEEVRHYRRFPMNQILFGPTKLMEKVILRWSTSISCVSHPFRQYLLRNGGDFEKISVIPNGVDTTLNFFDPNIRSEVRQELGLEDHLVFVYSGSTKGWYRLEETLRLYKAIQQRHSRSWLLILSYRESRFQELCAKGGISNYSIYRLDPDQVPIYLMAADYAFLLRVDDPVTRFSSPIKFAEYLAAGNKIIITKNIGDSSRLVQENNAGVVADLSNFDEIVPKVINVVTLEEKKRIAQLAKKELNKNRIYSELLASLGL